MGYLADIVRDSRRRADAPSTTGENVAVGDVELSSAVPVFPDGVPVELIEGRSGDPSAARIREEGSGFVTPQVVGLSPSEHIPAAGLPKATFEGLHLPNPVTHKQAGCESARTVTDDFRAEQTESFRDGDSNDAPAVSGVEDGSSILESSPGYAAASRAGKVSAETQGRRQAGVTTRAGATTPPEQFALQEAAELPGEHAEEPASGPLPKAFTEPAPLHRQGLDFLPGAMRSENDRPEIPQETGSFVEEARRPLLPENSTNRTVTVPAGIPVAEVRIGQAARQRSNEEKSAPAHSARTPEPRVRIGTIEVVVVSPATAETGSSRGERSRPDPASRNYLRNF